MPKRSTRRGRAHLLFFSPVSTSPALERGSKRRSPSAAVLGALANHLPPHSPFTTKKTSIFIFRKPLNIHAGRLPPQVNVAQMWPWNWDARSLNMLSDISLDIPPNPPRPGQQDRQRCPHCSSPNDWLLPLYSFVQPVTLHRLSFCSSVEPWLRCGMK